MSNLDKYRGCLIGGAAGDALGYVNVEFKSKEELKQLYGPEGVTKYRLVKGKALISDDTQMTLFTANGLLNATTRGVTRGVMGPFTDYIHKCYQEWYRLQSDHFRLENCSDYAWLCNVPELYANRAAGITCLKAIQSKIKGSVAQPINDSKGCGGVMRVAPIGLYFNGDNYSYTVEEIDMIGAEAAALTHGHELGYIPAAALVHIIYLLSHNDDVTLVDAIDDMKKTMQKLFAKAEYLSYFISLIDRAIELSKKDMEDIDAIEQLGAGWVAEETLAIAVYCALKYSDDFDKALIASVNHSGDSDSTGAVTGNILGAYLGLSGIPEKYLKNLEIKEVILEMADDLYNDCPLEEDEEGDFVLTDSKWKQKYCDHTYFPETDALKKIWDEMRQS